MKDPIAIVGMACRYPDARSPAELWENVLAQRRTFRRIPAERLRLEDYHSPDRAAPDRLYSTQAALITDYEFDRVGFRVTGRSFRSTDLTHWLALDVAAQALADAGFAGGEGLPRESTGVLVGNSLTGEFARANLMRLRWPFVYRVVAGALVAEGWDRERCERFLGELEKTYKTPYPPVTEETLAGGLSNTIAGRICNHFDLKGGGYVVDGACSSSLLAIANACSALSAGDLDVAVAGGVDLSLDPFELVGFAKTGALAAEEMRVYDARSAGFWPGEGCGMVVLTRLEDALAAGRYVYATIPGWGISSDGSGGLTRPEADGQLLALRRAYRRAGCGIDTVGYFEGHGTGTAVGDATELAALSSARREAGARTAAALGSIKANIGHTKAAAGVAGLIKATQAIRHQTLPPHTGWQEPHPELAGEAPALRLLDRPEPWPEDQPLRAAVSAMGFGGINAHLILDGAATDRRGALDTFDRSLLHSSQDAELFLLAAASREDLLRLVERLLGLAEGLSRAELADLAAELARGLDRRPVRAALVAATPEELERGLETLRSVLGEGALEEGRMAFSDGRIGLFAARGTRAPRLGFLFPGQGSPAHVGGGALRRRFEPVDELYRRVSLPAGDAADTTVAQPAIVVSSVAGLRVLETLGISAAVGVGHSLGELTALHWAGALGCDALLELATVRGRAMGELGNPTGAMAAVEAAAPAVEELLGDGVAVSGYNSPRQTVVSGEAAAVSAVIARAESRGLTARRLKVSHAFHSPLVEAATPRLGEFLERVEIGPVRRSVASTILGRLLKPADDLAGLVLRQITAPVLFIDAVAAAGQVDLWIEVGPGRVLSGLAADLDAGRAVATDAGGPSLKGTLQAVGAAFALGVPIHHRLLFAGRFVRPFDLDRRPRFFANPCEWAPLPEGLAPGPARELPAEAAEEPAAPAAADPSSAGALETVRRLVAQRAELPDEAVRGTSRLLSDLHLSSISVGQVVSEAARQLGLPPPVAPTEFADATVAEVSEALSALAETSAGGEARPLGPPPGVDSWVRTFTVELVERPLAELPSGEAPGRGSWQVLAPPDHPLSEALEEAFRRPGGGGGVALCLPPEPGDGDLALLLAAARAVGRLEPPRRLVVVQQNGGGGGFARTLYLEMPDVDVCVCDVPFEDPRAVDRVVSEARAAEGYTEAHYDAAGVRREPLLKLLEPGAAGEPALGPDDVLLVTGGGKGIAAECALALARQTGVRLALLGRSRPSADAELAANLERFAEHGVEHRYLSADVTDAAAVAAAVAEAQRELGPVTAFLHGAGVNVPHLLSSLDEETFRRTVAAKILGAENVLAALDGERLRLWVAFGSIIARIGMKGEADYATANEWLARRVERYGAEHPSCRCLTLEWSVWSGVGMGERLGRIEALVREGISPIPVDEGVRVLVDLLARPLEASSVVISGRFGEVPTLRLERPDLPLRRFLEQPRVFYPRVELVADSELSATTDPYLADHVYRGERLFPAVMALEAMSQAAMVLAETAEVPVFEDVRFDRPMAVPDGGTMTLRLAALVRRPGRVEVTLRSSLTGYSVDHFRAACRFARAGGADGEASRRRLAEDWNGAERLPIRPESDLYGGILFHEGRFRRLEGYRRLRATECLAEISPDGHVQWFGGYLPTDLVLGDPAARDAAIHGIQACIPHATVLPIGVDRLESVAIDRHRPMTLAARERRRDGKTFVYDLELSDARGELCERWEGLRLRAVDNISAPPRWVTPLLAPYIERRLEELVPGTGVAVALERRDEDDRRAASDRVLERLLGPGAPIRRRPDGKPEVCGGRRVSIAHSGDLVLAVAGWGLLGCDLQAVTPRAASQWRDLLGEDRFRLAELLAAAEGEDPDIAATRVWAAVECLKKAGTPFDVPLTFASSTADGWRLLRWGGDATLGTLVVPLRELGGMAALAVLAGAGRAAASEPPERPYADGG